MLEFICHNWTWLLPLYCFANWAPMWYIIYTHKRWDPELHKNELNAPFLRTDYPQWSYVWTMFTHLFFWPRYVFLYAVVGMLCFIGSFIMIGQDKNVPLHPMRY